MLNIEKIIRTIEDNSLITKGDKVVVAVSGGPDSVCLLHILLALKNRYELQLYVAHFNHNFRGLEAQKDAQYVADLCEELEVMCFVKSENVAVYAKENNLSDEEAGRIKRYEFFREVKKKTSANKIAVGHNFNDQAETVLMRLLRGAGLQGLSAIHYKRGDVIRPLLDVEREDIEDYCVVNELNPKTDITNLKPVYHRNKIRLELIPYLKENYNPNLLEALVRTAKILKADSDYLDSQAYDIFKLICSMDSNEKISIPIPSIDIMHVAMKTRLFRLASERLVGKREVFSYTHIQSILALVSKKNTGKRLQLPMGITALINYDKLIFTTSSEIEYDYSYKLKVDELVEINELGAVFTAKILNRTAMKKINVDNNKKIFDFDKVKNDLIIRNRNVGDVFRPLGMKGKKKLKDFFIDNKVERSERSKTALICDGGKIMWVVGHRISDYYKVTKQTTTFLLIEYHDEKATKMYYRNK